MAFQETQIDVSKEDGHQPPGDLLGAARPVAAQQLGGAALRGHRSIIGAGG